MTETKQVHWTKRPENKAKVAAMIAKGKRTSKKAKTTKHSTIRRQTNDAPARREIAIEETPVFAYALGHVEAWLETYAKSADISSETLASKLGKVLQLKARR